MRLMGTGERLGVKHIKTETFPYLPAFRTRLLASRNTAADLARLTYELGDKLAEAASELLKHAEKEGIKVDFIASDGHTAAHYPPRNNVRELGTLQIGEPGVIAERCKLPVVSHFRARDVAANGQGAPLSVYSYWRLFHRQDRTSVCLDLGGIASMAVIPPDYEDVAAFEVGPGTVAIDGAMRFLTAGMREVDTNGDAARKGVVIDEFLEHLLDNPYLNRVPPKSTSWEEFGPDSYLRDALAARRDYSLDDLVATCTTAVAYSIIRAYNRFVRPHFTVDRFIVMGGGVRNKALLDQLTKGLPDAIMRTSEDYGLPCEAMGGISVAILGNETLCGTTSNIPHATGSKHPVLLGSITPQG